MTNAILKAAKDVEWWEAAMDEEEIRRLADVFEAAARTTSTPPEPAGDLAAAIEEVTTRVRAATAQILATEGSPQ